MAEKIIKIVGLCDEDRFEEFEDLVNAPNINCLVVLDPVKDTPERAASYPADAVVLLSDDLSERETEYIDEYFRIRKGSVCILVCRNKKNLDVVEKAMDCGISKVLQAADGCEEICAAIASETAKIAGRDSTAQAREYESKVIAVYSPKGGAGKTVVSTNIATELYNRGKKVTMIDMDLSFGDVNAALAVTAGDTLAELCEERYITPKIIKGYLRHSSCGPDIISAPSVPERADIVEPDVVAKVIETLRADNDYVVIDCYQQLCKNTRRVLKECDTIYLVLNPEIPNIASAETFIHKFIERNDYRDKLKLIINKSDSSEMRSADISEKLGCDIFAQIPFDAKAVSGSLNLGEPIMSKNNVAPWSVMSLVRPSIKKAFSELVDNIEKVGEIVE